LLLKSIYMLDWIGNILLVRQITKIFNHFISLDGLIKV
jgi:hypothetical protein